VVTIFRRDEVGHTYVKHDIHVQYAVVSIAVYGRLQHLTKTWSCPKMPKVAPFPYVANSAT